MRTTSYSEIGQTINTTSIEEALTQAKLNYEVEKKDIFTSVGDCQLPISKKQATVDVTNNRVLGVVSNSYEICNNKDAFDFINYIDNDIILNKAGETKSGLVYIIGSLPEINVLGDTFTPNVIFQNSHNGGYSLRAAIVPLRIICQNQFNMAFKEANNTITIKHTASLKDKMEQAKITMNNTATYLKEFAKKAEHYASIKVSDEELKNIVNDLFKVKEDASDLVKERINAEKVKFLQAYNHEDNMNFKGTTWGIINGYTDYLTHQEPTRVTAQSLENHFITTTIDPKAMIRFMQIVNSRVAA